MSMNLTVTLQTNNWMAHSEVYVAFINFLSLSPKFLGGGMVNRMDNNGNELLVFLSILIQR